MATRAAPLAGRVFGVSTTDTALELDLDDKKTFQFSLVNIDFKY